MKRDFDLARDSLLAIENNNDATGRSRINLEEEIKNYSTREIYYHVQLLDEAGLIEAMDLSTLSGYRWEPKRLTWQGHDFLDSSRNETLWKEAKKRMKKIGNSSFPVLLDVLIGLGKQQLGI